MIDIEVESRIRNHLDCGQLLAAVESFIVGYGPSILNSLRRQLRNEETAQEVFSEFCALLCEELQGFRWQSAALTWGMQVARNAGIRRCKQDQLRRLRHVSMDHALVRGDEAAEPQTDPYQRTPVRSRLQEIIDSLPEEEQTMLHLIHVQSASWRDVDQILYGPTDEREVHKRTVNLRQRYSRLLARLEQVLDRDAQQRIRRILESMPQLERTLLQETLWKGEPWPAVCATVAELAPGLLPSELRQLYRRALATFSAECARSGVLSRELVQLKVLPSTELPSASPLRNRRRRR